MKRKTTAIYVLYSGCFTLFDNFTVSNIKTFRSDLRVALLSSDLGGLEFKEEADGSKWVRGADSVWVRLGSPLVVGVGTGTKTFDIVAIFPNYQSLTVDNFVVDIQKLKLLGGTNGSWQADFVNSPQNYSKSYNESTGKLTLNFPLNIYTNSSYWWARNEVVYRVLLVQ